MKPGVNYEIANDVARVTINNPEKRNAISFADLQALDAAFDAAAASGARALVLTGAGDRAFSGGVDLSDVGDTSEWDDNPLKLLSDKLEALPMPTIARVNGAVIGGAVELSLACDFRIGVDGAKIMVPAGRIGIHYEPAGLRRAMAALGVQTARRIYLLGETFTGSALADVGFLDRMVAPEGLDAAIEEMLASVRGGAPLAVNGMKTTFVELSRGALDEPAARARIRATWASEDMKEGLAAIQNRRPPQFKGR